jgi:hypothetical protein
MKEIQTLKITVFTIAFTVAGPQHTSVSIIFRKTSVTGNGNFSVCGEECGHAISEAGGSYFSSKREVSVFRVRFCSRTMAMATLSGSV